jgi:3-oxoacyl-[acyl-carrier protein] reductase
VRGARVFLAGRSQPKLAQVTQAIHAAGGMAEYAVIDALDEPAVEAHAAGVAARAGSVDIAFNAIGATHVQGVPFLELSLADYEQPIHLHTRANFLTARAAARHMAAQRSGVILTVSTTGAKMSGAGFLGFGVTCGAVETFSRLLAAELGASGVRVVCLRSDAIPEAMATSHSAEVFRSVAKRAGTSAEAMFAERARSGTLLGRFPTLAELANVAVFVASERASAMTSPIMNLSCGSVAD